MLPANPLDEFGSEFPSAAIGTPPAEPPPVATSLRQLDDACPHESASDARPLASVPGSVTTAPALSLEEILRRQVAVHWEEAVAVIEEVCALAAPDEKGVPDPSDLLIADSTVARRDGARAESDISSAGRLLHSLLSTAGSPPVPLRLFVTQASAQGTYTSMAGFAQALAYFGKPDRRELIRALYLRAAAAATSAPLQAHTAAPKHEGTSSSTPPDARRRRSIPQWAAVTMAAIVLTAAGVWGWMMRSSFAGEAMLPSLVAQAREALDSLGIGGPDAQPEAPASAAAAPEVRRDAGSPARLLPADAPRLVSRAFGPTAERRPRSRRPPRPPMPLLVQPPQSAELSSRSADEIEREAGMLTIYSAGDADVEPPLLLYPQIPANLMLAGESRLNIMEILVSETGLVERVHLIAGPTRLPDVMLLSGAKAWRFKPASRDGEAVRYRALVSWAGTP